MQRAKEILKNHFGNYYQKLEKWEFFNHVVNAMVDYKNEDVPPNLDLHESTAWKDVLKYLNSKSGHNYRFVGPHKKIIEARLKDKYSVEDLKAVIDIKSKEWAGTKQSLYLRPSTLFNATKIEGYLNQVNKSTSTGDDNFEFKPTDEAELL